MENSQEILDELNTISPFWNLISRRHLYKVPEGYFDQLPTHIQSEILLNDEKAAQLTIPSGYFDHLSDAILDKIANRNNEFSEELETLAPLLNTIRKDNLHKVPDNYFENFTVNVKENKKATIVAWSGVRKWVSYAAAAMIAAVLVTGGFLYNYHNSSAYILKEIKNVSDEELNSYIKDHVVALSEEKIELRGDAAHVKESLKLSTDAELQQYLNENAETYSEVTLKTD
jgi:hypothetical protein